MEEDWSSDSNWTQTFSDEQKSCCLPSYSGSNREADWNPHCQSLMANRSYRSVVLRVVFTAQDPQSIRDAFVKAKPNSEYLPLGVTAIAPRQVDHVYNLSLTCTATVTLARGARSSG